MLTSGQVLKSADSTAKKKTNGLQSGQVLGNVTVTDKFNPYVTQAGDSALNNVFNNPNKVLKQAVEGNPVPHVNPTVKTQNSTFEKTTLSSAKEALAAGKDLTGEQLSVVKKYGLSYALPNSATAEYDIFADNNPLNKARFERVKTITAKQKNGESITEDENNTLETFKLINEYKKSGGKATGTLEARLHSKDSALMTGNTTENAYKMQDVKAKKLYNEATYGSDKVEISNKEFEVKEGDTAAKALRGVQNKGKTASLYINAGLEQYAQGLNTTADVLTGKSPEKIGDSPEGAYSTANAMLKQYYTEHGEKLNSIIQDTVTNIANNAPGMIVGAVTGVGWLGQATFGISVFGNAYKEGTKLGIYDPAKLLIYSIATTASEVGLERLIGGLPGMGGVLSGEVISGLSKNVSSAVAKAVIKIAGNAVGEFIEEGTQSLLSPILQKYILGADVETVVDDPLGALSDAAYEGFIGALTSVLTGGIGSYSEAVYERNVQASGKYYNTVFKENRTDVKNVAKFFEETSEKKTDLNTLSAKVAKGDTSNLAVGNMMRAVAQTTRESNAAMFAKIGENVRNSENGVAAAVSSYEEAVNENKNIFPDKVEKLYNEVKQNGESVTAETLGEFALAVETYAPRAAIMGDIVGKTFGTETETELAQSEIATDTNVGGNQSTGVFTEYSTQKPEYDMLADGLNYGTGKVRLSDGQLKLKVIGKKLGRNIVFENTKQTQGFKSDGYIDTDGTIHIDYKAAKPVEFVLKHELTHFSEGTDEYKSFAKEVKNSKAYEEWINRKVGGVEKPEIKSAIYRERVINNYKANGIELTPVQAEAELIADFAGEVLFKADGSGLQSIMSDMSTTRRGRFVNFFKNFIAYLKAKFTHNKSMTAEVLKLENLFNKALTAAEQNNSTAAEGNAKFSINDVEFSQSDLEKNIESVSQMKSVADLSGQEFVKGEKDLVTQVSEFFDKYNNSVENDILGDVDITARGIKDSIAHGLGRNKAIAFAAVPQVIKDGRIIDYQTNWKGRGYDTVVLAAPITISGKSYYEGVIVTRNNETQRFYLHEVITEERTESPFKTGNANSSAKPGGNSSPSVISILNKIKDVNGNISETDSEGNKLSSEQQKYFANSKVRNKDGNLLVMYHGTKTENGDFYVFDYSKAVKKGGLGLKAMGKGNYFTSKKLDGTERFGSRVIKAYLNITNPFIYDNSYGDAISLAQQVKRETGIDTDGMTADELQNKMRKLGYDGVIEYRRDSSLGVAVAFDSEQIKEIDNTNPTTDPDIRYSIPEKQSELLEKYEKGEMTREEYLEESNKIREEAVNTYGAFKEGENAKVKIPVPKAVREGKNTEQFVKTVIESGRLSNGMLEDVGAEMLEGGFEYKPVTDEQAQTAAEEAIVNGKAELMWENAVNASKFINKNAIATGEKLLQRAIERKDTRRVLELTAELSDVLTRNGQNVQAARMFKKMTGAVRLVTIQKFVDKMNSDRLKKYKGTAKLITLDERLAEQMAATAPGEDTTGIYIDLMRDVASQTEATFLDKWNAWRYTSMLTNPTTHIRNIVGNAIFTPSVRMKDFTAAVLEKMFVEESQRTKVIKTQKKYRDFAEKDAARFDVKNALANGGQYSEASISQEIAEYQKVFKTRWLEFVRKGNSNLLEAEDAFFKNIHYKHALAGFLQARGIDLNNVTERTLWKARAYAMDEALKATFNDANSIARVLNNAAKGNKYADVIINGVLPFKKTPVNIVRRGVEYSPIGLLSTITKGTYDLKKGNITATEFIDGMGAGISGTAVFALGMLLASLGFVTGSFGDDKEDEFRKLNGEQEYALQIGGKSYTIDWAAPACIPFFIGVELMNEMREEKEDFSVADVSDVMWNSFEPILELSMLSGVQSMIESVKYADNGRDLISLTGNITKSYFSQGLPTVGGKLARTFDSKRRSNYIDKNSKLSEFSQGVVNTVKSKIPGLENMRPEYVDEWGRTESNGNFAERLLGNFLSPGYGSEYGYDELSEELLRLSKVKEVASNEDLKVFPQYAKKSFSVNGKTKYLTADEYVKYAKAKGEYSRRYAEEFFESSVYGKLTDEERAFVLTELYSYANAKAKTEVSDYDISEISTFKAAYKRDKNGASVPMYYVSKALSK